MYILCSIRARWDTSGFYPEDAFAKFVFRDEEFFVMEDDGSPVAFAGEAPDDTLYYAVKAYATAIIDTAINEVISSPRISEGVFEEVRLLRRRTHAAPDDSPIRRAIIDAFDDSMLRYKRE